MIELTQQPRITFVGAGSTAFTARLVTDLLATSLEPGTFVLVDIDRERLDLVSGVVRKLVEETGSRWKVEASRDRRSVLGGSRYVINSIEVAGLANVRPDYEIPLRFGIDQCIGDTIGPGGIFKALRTGPEWLDIVRDVAELAPDAVLLNYTNPMSILTLAATRSTSQTVLGLCHSVQGTSQQLAEYLDVPYDELEWQCAGINHNAWFTTLEIQGEDAYPRLRDLATRQEVWEQDPVRFEVMKHLGAFVTESSGHFSEYVPYFRKRPDLVRRFTRSGYLGESGFYARNWPSWRMWHGNKFAGLIDGVDAGTEWDYQRSPEYASFIIEALECDRSVVIHANVSNGDSIENLPSDGCVEIPVRIDGSGIEPLTFGRLPEHLAALNRSHLAVHELVTQALLERDREKARLALMLDPLSAAVCSLDEISDLFDQMWDAEREYLLAFS